MKMLPAVAALCAAGLLPHSVNAGAVELDNGVTAIWSLSTTLSAGWRASNPDPALVGIGDGGTAAGYTGGPATMNFKKGDNYSTLLRVVGDVNLKKDNYGLMVRAKAWKDFRLSNGSVPVGAPSNDYTPNARLSDANFDSNLSKFSGVELLDAYVYGDFDVSETSNLKVKLGSHAVNWGESLFVPGVNRYSVLDITALRQPGTQVKEAILPVPQVSMNLGIDETTSVEAFYQFKWKRSVLDGCGTYWSVATSVNCRNDAMLVASDSVGSWTSAEYWNGIPALGGANLKIAKAPDRKPKNSGQFGLSLKKTVESLDTELGAYFVNYTTHLPIISSYRTTDTIPGSVYNGLGTSGWNYDARSIKVTGLSAATAINGWAVAGEVSYTKGYPVQLSPVDGFYAFAANVGPQVSRAGFAAAPPGSGAYIASFDRKNFFQGQVSTIKTFSNVYGIPNISLVGEVAFQHWSGIGDPYSSIRYGRGFEFGAAQHAAYGGACMASNPAYCTQDGYFTSNAWGVRGQVEMEFPNAVAGVNLKPRVFYSRDVKGWSADGVFNEGRQAISLGLKAEYLRKYTVDLSYTRYNHNATFDSLHDRDFIGLAISAAF